MPLLRPNNASSKTKGWILIPKESVKEVYQKFKPKIDSLIKAGFEFHYLNKGFVKADFNKVLTDAGHYSNVNASYWSLMQQLNGQILSLLPVYVFTSNSATHFFPIIFV